MKIANLKVWPIDRIKPYDKNVKIHDQDQVARIAKSIKEFGWDQPIVVDADGVIIKGHGRRLAAISLGLKEVPVLIRDDLTPAQVRAARLADNRVAMSGIDTELLRKELADLDFDLSGIFDAKEIDFSLADLGEMNGGVFVEDVDLAVMEQEQQAREKSEEVASRRVPLTKVFGFKDVAGSDEIHLNRFMAFIEHRTGKQGEAALIAFAKSAVEELSHE